jgi:hypothetical protein
MIERRRRQIGHAVATAPRPQKEVDNRQMLRPRVFRQRPQNPFRAARRAGGIEHRGAEGFAGNRRVGKFIHRRIEIDDPVAVAGTVDNEAAFDPRALRQCLQRDLALRRRGEEDLRLAVVENVGRFARRQIRIDAGIIEARAFAGAAAFGIAGVVLHEDRVVVEPFEAVRPQKMGEPVAAPVELGISDGFAALRHDDGRLVRPHPGLQTRIHRHLPGLPAAAPPATLLRSKSRGDGRLSTRAAPPPADGTGMIGRRGKRTRSQGGSLQGGSGVGDAPIGGECGQNRAASCCLASWFCLGSCHS